MLAMKPSAGSSSQPPGGRGFRRCLRAGFDTRTGRAVGASSVLVPLVSYVVYDLQQPDSTVKRLVSAAAGKLLTWRESRHRLTDITDKVEVVAESERT